MLGEDVIWYVFFVHSLINFINEFSNCREKDTRAHTFNKGYSF